MCTRTDLPPVVCCTILNVNFLKFDGWLVLSKLSLHITLLPVTSINYHLHMTAAHVASHYYSVPTGSAENSVIDFLIGSKKDYQLWNKRA